MLNFKTLKRYQSYYPYLLFIISLIVWIFVFNDPLYDIKRYVSDDAYYYFTLARNVLSGEGIVFNDGIPTNGFHPLYLFIILPIFQLFSFNIYLPVYVSLLVLYFFHIGTGILLFFIGKVAYKFNTGVIMSLFWLYNPYLIQTVLLGLETPIQGFFIALLVYYLLKKRNETKFQIKESIIIGIIISLIILARLDGVFFIFAVGLVMSYRKIKVLKNDKKLRLKSIIRVIDKDLIIMILIPAICTLLWMIWSFNYVGLFTPMSGNYLRSLYTPNNFDGYIRTIFHSFQNYIALIINLIFYPPSQISLQLVLTFIFYGIPILIVIYFWIIKKDKFLKIQINNFAILIIFFLFYSGYYIFYQFYIRNWYAIFPCLFTIIFISLFISYILDKLKVFLTSRKTKIKLTKNFPKYLGIVILVVFVIDFSYNYYEINTHLNADRSNIRLKMIEYLNNNIPLDKKVGSFNTGELQYYDLNRDIINLDGVMNSQSYFAYTEGRFGQYLIDSNIIYILDSIEFISFLNESTLIQLKIVHYFGNTTNPYFPNIINNYYLFQIECL
jgi:hypothetical protein